jgi:hypothetical protein
MKFIRFAFVFISIILILACSYLSIELLSFSQVKKDYNSLNFIPDNSEFVIRIEAKEIAKDYLTEIITKNLWSELNSLKKIEPNKKDSSSKDLNDVDLKFPVYLFSLKFEDQFPFIIVLNTEDSIELLDNKLNTFKFQHEKKLFYVFNCNSKLEIPLKNLIQNSKSTNWTSLLSTKYKISFKTKILGLDGGLDFSKNEINLTSTIQQKNKFESYEGLKPNGFHISISKLSNLIPLLSNTQKVNFDYLQKLNSLSVNYLGVKYPYTPHFELLINTSDDFDISQFSKKIGMNNIDLIKNKIEFFGLSFYFNEIKKNQYLITSIQKGLNSKEVKKNPFSMSGNLNVLTNLDDAPLMKLFMATDSRFVKLSNFANKTKYLDCKITSSRNQPYSSFNAKIIMQDNVSIYSELLKLFIP